MQERIGDSLPGNRSRDFNGNWARNVHYRADRFCHATSVDEIRAVVSTQPRVKVLGTRHCFNTIADSEHVLLSIEAMNRVLTIDHHAATVTVEGGITYGQLCPQLHSEGFALKNLASLPHISIAGACSTATHGSGERHGNLATSVAALEMVTAAGDILTLDRCSPSGVFQGAIVGLGALGVISRLTLDIVPTYEIRQWVFENLPLNQLLEHFDDVQTSGYSVSLFTDWQQQRINQVWIKDRLGDQSRFIESEEFFGAHKASENLHPLSHLPSESCTTQMGIAGPWYDRLPHFRFGFTPSAGHELQSEYFVARTDAEDAIMAVERLRNQIAPHLLISEIRTVAEDELWMSPCYRRPSIAIHFTWKPDFPAVMEVLPVIERELSPFRPRPHWGKLFTLAPETIRECYERLPDFVEMARRLDGTGKFRNEFLNEFLFTS
jgi:xylitol oxidase